MNPSRCGEASKAKKKNVSQRLLRRRIPASVVDSIIPASQRLGGTEPCQQGSGAHSALAPRFSRLREARNSQPCLESPLLRLCSCEPRNHDHQDSVFRFVCFPDPPASICLQTLCHTSCHTACICRLATQRFKARPRPGMGRPRSLSCLPPCWACVSRHVHI